MVPFIILLRSHSSSSWKTTKGLANALFIAACQSFFDFVVTFATTFFWREVCKRATTLHCLCPSFYYDLASIVEMTWEPICNHWQCWVGWKCNWRPYCTTSWSRGSTPTWTEQQSTFSWGLKMVHWWVWQTSVQAQHNPADFNSLLSCLSYNFTFSALFVLLIILVASGCECPELKTPVQQVGQSILLKWTPRSSIFNNNCGTSDNSYIITYFGEILMVYWLPSKGYITPWTFVQYADFQSWEKEAELVPNVCIWLVKLLYTSWLYK